MRVLLSDASGLTARQCATRLASAGHVVEALSPDPLCLCRFTRHVRRIRRVPAYGKDPFGWLDAALAAYRDGSFDVLFPTQEQVAVLSAASSRLREAGVATAVPSFAALRQVQDKISAFETLRRLGIPQPRASVINRDDAWDEFPIFVKTPIGTATTGVRRVSSATELRRFPHDGPVLAQAPVEGALAMVQTVFSRGELVAHHANLRVREGAGGGASHKRSLDLPDVTGHMRALGDGLGWHGALSADVILGPDGPVFIDVNPRLVEPGNAYHSGVDLVETLLDVARSVPPRHVAAPGPSGTRTHQLLLAVLGTAQHCGRRTAVTAELLTAALGRGDYRHSVEELTPLRRDPLALAPVAVAAVATLVRPRSYAWFTTGSVANYALTPHAWREIIQSS
ncbi:MAG TPA: hypothetical protein VFU43_09305 [Streptosporangiaceae bacterium]|nr:hypothetical protein [Streptosporangiaceae bacterium]